MIKKPNLKRVTILTPAEQEWECQQATRSRPVAMGGCEQIRFGSPRAKIFSTIDPNRAPERIVVKSRSPPNSIQFTIRPKRADHRTQRQSPEFQGFFSGISKPSYHDQSSILQQISRDKTTMSVIQQTSRPRKYFKT